MITVRGARLHNLKNVSCSIPKNRLVVFSGVSGSGKSTLAFDILHKEGQRQYMESLGMVTYESRPPVDAITGLAPAISVDQHSRNRSPRSTVGTATDVYTYLRVLFARIGHRPCPACGGDVPPAHASDEAVASLWEDDAALGALEGAAEETGGRDTEDDSVEGAVACPHCGAALPVRGMAFFSFNKPAGACPTCTGLGTVHTADLPQVLDEARSLADGAVRVWEPRLAAYYLDILRAAGRYYGCEFDMSVPVRDLGEAQRDLLLYGSASPTFRRHFPHKEPPATVARGRFEGVVANLLRRHAEHAADEDTDYLEKLARLLILQPCPACAGTRLRPEARAVTVAGQNIVAITRLPLDRLAGWSAGLQAALPADDWLVAAPIVADLQERVRRLAEVGLGYLTLDRATPSLSAGEAQRLRLAALLGSGLTGVLYVLDEPTIGLHPRDNLRLVALLRALRDLGNTVLVIEHDLEIVAAADWVVDFGPGGGRYGGEIVAEGPPAAVAQTPGSVTGQYLAGAAAIPIPEHRRPVAGPGLTIRGAREHNLQDVTAFCPRGVLTAVTGVSGSGKSSLLFDILDRAARRRFYGAAAAPGAHDGIDGWEHFDKVITVDQDPLGRSTRSNAATYTDVFTPIRAVFAAQPAARAHGLAAQHFSFNVPGGRCERCAGAGVLAVEMHFLPDVLVRCPVCHGRRFQRKVLAVQYKGCDIAQVLDLTIAEALALFADVPAVRARLELMTATGLGYLQLGQPAATFSGGEAQRVKLARELARRATGRTLYLLDEPTTGLHPADTAHLLRLLHRLVDAGNTVVVVEHNLDVVKCADWVIDLGPAGGEAGGRLVVAGTPETVAECPESITGQMMRRLLCS